MKKYTGSKYIPLPKINSGNPNLLLEFAKLQPVVEAKIQAVKEAIVKRRQPGVFVAELKELDNAKKLLMDPTGRALFRFFNPGRIGEIQYVRTMTKQFRDQLATDKERLVNTEAMRHNRFNPKTLKPKRKKTKTRITIDLTRE